MDDALVEAGSAHHELRDATDESEERVAGVILRERFLRERASSARHAAR